MNPSVEELNIANSIIDTLITKLDVNSGLESMFAKWKYSHKSALACYGIEVDYGSTKAVFISPKLEDWVIKTDIKGYSSETKDISFCTLEYENYQQACVEGLDSFFASIYKIREGWYLQERLEANDDKISQDIYDMIEDGDQYDDIYSAVEDLEDEERLKLLYEDDKLIEFIERIMATNELAPDLHTGNFGYRKDGTIVLMDYSGY